MAVDSPIISLPAEQQKSVGKGRLHQFFGWWRSELLAALPQIWRERLSGVATGAPLVLLPEAVVTLGWVQGSLREVARLPLSNMEPAARADSIKRLVRETGGRVEGAVLALPAECFVSRIIELPGAAEEALQQVIGFELDRHTPFKASQAYFSAVVVGHARDDSSIRVQIVAAPRDVVNDLVQRAGQMGLGVGALLPWNPDADLASRQFNLLAAEARQSTGISPDLKLGIGLGALFAILFFAALLLPLWQKREAAISLLPKLNAAKAESEKVQKTRAELERLVADANFIQGKKHVQVPVTLLMEDLARILPDTTWVAALEVKAGKQRELVLTGETASATKVLELLEQVPYLKSPNFRSPLTKVPGQASEKFVIAAEIKARALPSATEEPLAGSVSGPANLAPTSPAVPAVAPGSVPVAPAPAGSAPQPAVPTTAPASTGATKNPAPNPAKVEVPKGTVAPTPATAPVAPGPAKTDATKSPASSTPATAPQKVKP